MSDKAEIKKIVLDLGDVEVTITPGQAKKLYQMLDEMYGSKGAVTPITYPVILRDDRWWWERPQPMWASGSGFPNATYTADTQTLSLGVV